METQNNVETWEQRIARERLEEIARINKKVRDVYSSINDKLPSQYAIELIERASEHYPQPELEIKITHDKLEFFKVSIFGRVYNAPEKAHVSFENEHRIHKVTGNCFDGSLITSTDRYEFDHKLSNDELRSCGLESIDYSIRLWQLNFDFKASKKPALILNQLLPKLESYQKIVALAEPRINAQVWAENDKLNFSNSIALKHGSEVYNEMKNRSFEFSFGTVEISQYGDISLSKTLNRDELLALIESETK